MRTYRAAAVGAEGLEEPVRLVGEAEVRLAQLQQEPHKGGGPHEVSEGDDDAELGQIKLHLFRERGKRHRTDRGGGGGGG